MRPVRSFLRGSAHPLTEDHDVALLDLDGVVYIGPDAVPGAARSLATARQRGMRLAFVTNNAARPPHAVADHLTELGIAARASEVVTSAQAAARYLAQRLPGGARVLVVGTTGLYDALRERGLKPVGDAQGQVDAVVQGYSPDMTWQLLAEGAVAINRGVPWVATNVDPTVPSPRGPLPGNGSLVAALRHATRAIPVVTGKPDPTMHRESLLRSESERPIVVGDRLDTDIEGANAVGCPSLLVFTGVTTVRDLLDAPPNLRPTYLGSDLSALLTSHPEPRSEGAVTQCGAWHAERAVDRVTLWREKPGLPSAADRDSGAQPDTGQPEPFDLDTLDAIRALCVAYWADPGRVRGPAAARSSGPSESGNADVPGGRATVAVRSGQDDDAAHELLARVGLA